MAEGYAAIFVPPPPPNPLLTTALFAGTVSATFTAAATVAGPEPVRFQLAQDLYKLVVPNSVAFSWNGLEFYDRNGTMYHSFDPETGSGVIAGSIDYTKRIVTLTDAGDEPFSTAAPIVTSLLLQPNIRATAFVRFRTPGAPLRPGSFIVRATGTDGTLLTGTSSNTGVISGAHVRGAIDFENGIAEVNFNDEILDSGAGPFPHRAQPWYNVALQFTRGGNTYVIRPFPVDPSTIVFNTVVYTAIPLDADLIGIDPVRLPSDGRVPIFKQGYVILVHDTRFTTAPNNLISGQVVTLTRPNQTYIVVRDQNGLVVPDDRYTTDLAAGTVTINNPVNLQGFQQPLILEDRIEDMLLCTDVQITGELSVARALKHDYDATTALVSSALLFGDLQARYVKFFDQQTWANVWADIVTGNRASSSFNDVDFPLEVTDEGAITQRWALVFTSTTAFNVIGEEVGLIATGNTGADLAPNNPSAVDPYFTLHKQGWGTGWVAGNVVRFNTIGALAPIWFARTTIPGDDSLPALDHFKIQVRGDAE